MASLKEEQLESYLIGGQARFYRLAYSYLQDREEALDAVQTAVCRALQTWFTRILVNACMDLLRQRKRVAFVPPEALESGSYEDPLPEDGALASRVNALPPETQTVVKLRFYEDMSLKEISEVTGCNLNTVKSRLYAGLKKLRVSLEGVTLE